MQTPFNVFVYESSVMKTDQLVFQVENPLILTQFSLRLENTTAYRKNREAKLVCV